MICTESRGSVEHPGLFALVVGLATIVGTIATVSQCSMMTVTAPMPAQPNSSSTQESTHGAQLPESSAADNSATPDMLKIVSFPIKVTGQLK
jgi:hypothetical protein